jgi:homoaconitate hydratase
VAGPDTTQRAQPVAALAQQRVQIDKAYLMSCVNGRLSDFEAAAAVLADRPVAPGVQFYIAAASVDVEAQARARGAWEKLLNAGAIPLPPGCGACIGLGAGTLAAGEVGISATNRNFKGRMGHRDAQVYLASPAVVAASAAAGYITGPDVAPASHAAGGTSGLEELRAAARCTVAARPAAPSAVELLPGFPDCITGELLFLPVDNLNTDGIYGKEHTYREDLTPAEMAQVVCANYDPAFAQQVRRGDLLVAGANFGCGSSREQAATALRHAGIGLVIAESFSQTYKRNAFNNGFIVIECPPLIDRLRQQFATGKRPTIRTEMAAAVDFERGVIRAFDEAYPFAPLGQAAQQLIVAGGLEALIRPQLAAP